MACRQATQSLRTGCVFKGGSQHPRYRKEITRELLIREAKRIARKHK